MKSLPIKIESILFLILTCIIIVMRVLWNLYYPARLFGDCEVYFSLAKNIVAKGVFTQETQPDVFWPPLWPYVIALTMLLKSPLLSPESLLIYLQILNAILIWKIARSISPHLLVATIALLLYAFNPSHLLMSNVFNTELLFTLLFNLFILIVFKIKWLEKQASKSTIKGRHMIYVGLGFLSGLSLGLATLTRGITLPLIAFLALAASFKLKQGKLFNLPLLFWLVTILVAIIPVVLWSYRNYKVSGKFIIICANGAENLWLGHNPASSVIGWQPPDSPYREKEKGLSVTEKYSLWQKEAIKFILAHPFTAVANSVFKIRQLFSPALYEMVFHPEFFSQSGAIGFAWWSAINQFLWFIVLFGSFCFITFHFILPLNRGHHYDSELIRFIFSIIAFWIIIHCFLVGMPRYRYPVEHFFWLLSIIGFFKLYFARKYWKEIRDVYDLKLGNLRSKNNSGGVLR